MDWKKIGKQLLFPPIWLIAMLTVVSAVLLAAVFMKGLETSPIAYVSYVISFYTLSVITVVRIRILPKYYKNIKNKVYGTELGNRYMNDDTFKTQVSLYVSLTINLLYVATNLVSGICYGSVWFITIAAYYSVLAIMRFLLIRYANKNGIEGNKASELKRYRLCGSILMLINLTLSGMVILVIRQNHSFNYAGVLIYVAAMYTFYITITAIIDVIKYRKSNSTLITAAKVVKLSAALVSMLSLETAMLSTFGADTSAETRLILIAATGAGVCAVVVAMATYMIISSTKELQKFEINKT